MNSKKNTELNEIKKDMHDIKEKFNRDREILKETLIEFLERKS
jgi:hypothetical protein